MIPPTDYRAALAADSLIHHPSVNLLLLRQFPSLSGRSRWYNSALSARLFRPLPIHGTARHPGFTNGELDFIIHYDIKYHMSKDADSADDEVDGE